MILMVQCVAEGLAVSSSVTPNVARMVILLTDPVNSHRRHHSVPQTAPGMGLKSTCAQWRLQVVVRPCVGAVCRSATRSKVKRVSGNSDRSRWTVPGHDILDLGVYMVYKTQKHFFSPRPQFRQNVSHDTFRSHLRIF